MAEAPFLIVASGNGNTGGDWTGCIATQVGIEGNFCADPLFCGPLDGSTPVLDAGVSAFCLHADSPCLPGNHPAGYNCGLIGAHRMGCGRFTPPRRFTSASTERTAAVEPTTWGRIKAGYE
jgi:hypothetical protein